MNIQYVHVCTYVCTYVHMPIKHVSLHSGMVSLCIHLLHMYIHTYVPKDYRHHMLPGVQCCQKQVSKEDLDLTNVCRLVQQ